MKDCLCWKVLFVWEKSASVSFLIGPKCKLVQIVRKTAGCVMIILYLLKNLGCWHNINIHFSIVEEQEYFEELVMDSNGFYHYHLTKVSVQVQADSYWINERCANIQYENEVTGPVGLLKLGLNVSLGSS
jgi:hypothetical protein